MSQKGIERSLDNKEEANSLGRLLMMTDPNLTCRSRSGSENQPPGHGSGGLASEHSSAKDAMTRLQNPECHDFDSSDTTELGADQLLPAKQLDHRFCTGSPRPRRRRMPSCSKELSWEETLPEDTKDRATANDAANVKNNDEAVTSQLTNLVLGYFKKTRSGKSHP